MNHYYYYHHHVFMFGHVIVKTNGFAPLIIKKNIVQVRVKNNPTFTL